MVPWWNKTCGILRKVTRKCYRRYKNSGSSITKKIYQRALAKQRRYYRQVKKESWLFYINGISSKTPSRVIWRKIRKLSGKFVPTPSPNLKIDGDLITEPDKVAEKLGSHFAQISSPDNYSSHFQRIRNSQITLDLSLKSNATYNGKFTLRELREALSSCESTSPGEDCILYEMLKQLPEETKDFLLKIINKIWETGIMPKNWKVSLVVPIRNPLEVQAR